LASASVECIDFLEDFAGSSPLEVHFHRAGWFWTATSNAQLGALRAWVAGQG